MQRYTVYLYLETALHVSGGISTHHQELERSSNSSTIAAGSTNGLTNTRCCRYSVVLLMMGGGSTRNMWSSLQKKIKCVTLHLVS